MSKARKYAVIVLMAIWAGLLMGDDCEFEVDMDDFHHFYEPCWYDCYEPYYYPAPVFFY